jgi:hypothetical protein
MLCSPVLAKSTSLSKVSHTETSKEILNLVAINSSSIVNLYESFKNTKNNSKQLSAESFSYMEKPRGADISAYSTLSAPKGYSEEEYRAFYAFMVQEDSSGKSNAQKLGVDLNDFQAEVGGNTFTSSGRSTYILWRIGSDGLYHLSSFKSYGNQLHGDIDFSNFSALESFTIAPARGFPDIQDSITSLNFRNCTRLGSFTFKGLGNPAPLLDLRGCTTLATIVATNNNLKLISLSEANSLVSLDIRGTDIVTLYGDGLSALRELSISNTTSLESMDYSKLVRLNISQKKPSAVQSDVVYDLQLKGTELGNVPPRLDINDAELRLITLNTCSVESIGSDYFRLINGESVVNPYFELDVKANRLGVWRDKETKAPVNWGNRIPVSKFSGEDIEVFAITVYKQDIVPEIPLGTKSGELNLPKELALAWQGSVTKAEVVWDKTLYIPEKQGYQSIRGTATVGGFPIEVEYNILVVAP